MTSINTCPICEKQSIIVTEHSLAIRDKLVEWEKTTEVRFSKSVWDFYANKVTTLHHCNYCNFSFFSPIQSGTTDFYTDIMTKGGMTYVSDKWEFHQAIHDIRNFSANSILDIGCGSGNFLDIVKNDIPNAKRYGYELSPDVAEVAKQKGHKIYTGPFSQSIFNGQKFDVICSFQVMEHVDNPSKLISDMIQLLNSNGRLIISVPNIEGPVGKYFSFALTNVPPHHVSWWSESVFRKGLRRLGLKVIEARLEPLPSYLWSSYLPVILTDKLSLSNFMVRALKRMRVVQMLTYFANLIGIKELNFFQGHTIYVILQESKADER